MKTYLVGGAVRDRLLGYPHSERDWVVVGATPETMLAAGFKPVGKDFPVFLHPDTNEEYALARTERKTGPGYHGFAIHASPDVTLEEDLLRRDLTVNAMAEDADGKLIDPYGGRRDLEQHILRHVSPAFAEDPLRILRLARFAARYRHLDFRIAPETRQLMGAMVASGEVDALVPERVWKELERALAEPDPGEFFRTLRGCGALQRLLPELTDATALTWEALATAAASGAPATVRFALLAAELTPVAAQSLCARLRAPNAYRELALLVARWRLACTALATADDALELIEHTDALRRPERFLAWLQTCELLQTPARQTDRMRRALAAADSVTADTYLQQGLRGPALGAALRTGRLEAIRSIWT